MLAQIARQYKDVEQLICDGKTLQTLAAQPDGADGGTRFVSQVTPYARELGVAIEQTSLDTGESHERAALKAMLSTLETEGVFIQADARHTSPAFSMPRRAGAALLLTVTNNQRRLYQQILSQFRGHRHIPLVISDFEASHGRQVRWQLRARNALSAICQRWTGTS